MRGASARGGQHRPAADRVGRAATPSDLLVAEVSSFQLEATEQFRPRVAVLLNLLPDHLDRHGTMATYAEAKARVFAEPGARGHRGDQP